MPINPFNGGTARKTRQADPHDKNLPEFRGPWQMNWAPLSGKITDSRNRTHLFTRSAFYFSGIRNREWGSRCFQCVREAVEMEAGETRMHDNLQIEILKKRSTWKMTQRRSDFKFALK